MYDKSFFLEKDSWNNAFSYWKRTNKKLYVTNCIPGAIDTIELGEEIVFEDVDFSGNLQTCTWLKNFYKIPWKNKEILLFDNHNHAYFFWWEYYISCKLPLNPPQLRGKWTIVSRGSLPFTLIHIDEHSDMRDPGVYLKENPSLEEVFTYTNEVINVGNYIIPAIRDGLIKEEVVQIRDSKSLEDYFQLDLDGKDTILNLDLDFFEPALDFIDYDLKKKVVLDAAERADIITVATSPFFIDQQRAINVFKDIFGNIW